MSETYDRKRQVPSEPGTTPKPCTRCQRWFPAKGHQRACEGCLSPAERSRRSSRYGSTKDARSVQNPQRNGGSNLISPRSVLVDDLSALAKLHSKAVKAGLMLCGTDCLWCKADVVGVR